MKNNSLRIFVLGGAALVALFATTGKASAIDIGIRVGGPPPPPPAVVERPWHRPYPGAVWIAPHQEWRGGRWVWVHGYYAYPPRRGAVWIPAHYSHGYWRDGHWR